MKRIFSLALALVLFVSAFTPCLAAQGEGPSVMPCSMYITTYTLDFDINTSTGVTTSYADCTLAQNYEVQIVCELQRYNNSKWNTIKTWTSSGMIVASLNKTLAVPSGYTYRAYFTFKVYNNSGTMLESVSNSKSVYYPSN